jgi:predicted nucleotidyltransferase component of viral defense system
MFHLFTVRDETYQLLKNLFAIDKINSGFALAGGTALALQLGHRQSIDLDIFSPDGINTKELEILLSTYPGLDFEFVNSNKKMLFAFINKIKCDFVHEPAKLIQPFVEYEGVKYFSVADIAAMKMHTICGRGKKKDFFDIYALIERYGWPKMLEWFEAKYSSSQLYFLWRSIGYFDDADEDADIESYPPFTKSWMEIKKLISKECR